MNRDEELMARKFLKSLEQMRTTIAEMQISLEKIATSLSKVSESAKDAGGSSRIDYAEIMASKLAKSFEKKASTVTEASNDTV